MAANTTNPSILNLFARSLVPQVSLLQKIVEAPTKLGIGKKKPGRSIAEQFVARPEQFVSDILAGRPKSTYQAVERARNIIQQNPELVPGYGYAKFTKEQGRNIGEQVYRKTGSRAAANIAQATVETPGQLGLGIYSGGTHYLLPRVLTREQQEKVRPATTAGEIGRAYGSLRGFSAGPGRIYYAPIEAPVERGVASLFQSPGAGRIARALLPGLAAEATSSLPIAALRSYYGKQPFIEPGGKTPVGIPFTKFQLGELPIGGTYPEEVTSGVTSRAAFSTLGKAGQKYQEATGRLRAEAPNIDLRDQRGFIGMFRDQDEEFKQSIQDAAKEDTLQEIRDRQQLPEKYGRRPVKYEEGTLNKIQQQQFKADIARAEEAKKGTVPLEQRSRKAMTETEALLQRAKTKEALEKGIFPVTKTSGETIMPKTDQSVGNPRLNEVNRISLASNNSYQNRPNEVPEYMVQRAISDIRLKAQQNQDLPEVTIVRDTQGGTTIKANANYLEAARRMNIDNYPVRDLTGQVGFLNLFGGKEAKQNVEFLKFMSESEQKEMYQSALRKGLKPEDPKTGFEDFKEYFADQPFDASSGDMLDSKQFQVASTPIRVGSQVAGQPIPRQAPVGRLSPIERFGFSEGDYKKFEDTFRRVKNLPLAEMRRKAANILVQEHGASQIEKDRIIDEILRVRGAKNIASRLGLPDPEEAMIRRPVGGVTGAEGTGTEVGFRNQQGFFNLFAPIGGKAEEQRTEFEPREPIEKLRTAEEMGRMFGAPTEEQMRAVAHKIPHQQALAEAMSNNDYRSAKQILDNIPPGDPYKTSMENLFRTEIEQNLKGADVIKQGKEQAKNLVEQFKSEEGGINFGAKVGGKPPKAGVGEDLLQEARKYKSAEEFVNKFYTETTYDLRPGQTRMSAEGFKDSGLYHGATNIQQILDSEKIKAQVSQLDDIGEKVVSLTKSRGGADSYGIVFELDETIPHTPAPKGVAKGNVAGFEFRTSNDIPLSKVKSVTLPLNKKEGIDTKILVGFKGRESIFKKASELKKEFEDRGIKVFLDDGRFGNKSQLTDIWNKANKAGVGEGQEGFINLFAPVGTKAQQNLQDIQAGVKPAPDPLADTPLGKIRNSIKQDLPRVDPRDQTTMQQVRTQLVDRYAPVADLTKRFVESGQLKQSDDPYVDVRMYAGELNRVSQYLEDNYRPILKQLGPDMNKFSEYEAFRRVPDLAAKGIEKFPGGIKADDANQGLAQLREEVGEEKFAQFQQAEQSMRKYDLGLLQMLQRSGLMSADDVARISQSEEHYSPFYRIEYELDQLDRLPVGKKSFNLSNEKLVQSLSKKGSEKDLLDPLVSRIRQTSKYIAASDRNMAIRKIAELRNLEGGENLILDVKADEPIPDGYDTISYKEDGVKKEIAAPKPVIDSLKGMNQYQSDVMTRMARRWSGILRTGATAYNISFMVPNVFRDVTNAAIVHPDGMKVIANWNKGFWSALRKDDYWREWMRQGGGGTITQEFELTGRPSVESLSGKDLVSRIVSSPKDLITEIGRISEESTRLSMYRTALEEHPDMDPRYAAYLAREGTVDFSKMGTSMKIINQWVPFINARTQGTINLGKAWGIGEKIGSDEFNQKFSKAAFSTGLIVGLPALLTYLWNRQFEDSKDLSRYERDNNFVIYLRDRTPEEIARQKAEGREEHIALKIPKGDVGKIFGNPIEYVLRFVDGKTPNELDDLLANIVGEISPIGVPYSRETMQRTASTITPQLFKPLIETGFNVNLFTGRPIEPEYQAGVPREQIPEAKRSASYTGPFARLVGKTVLERLPFAILSPADIENIIHTTAGGLGAQVLELLDIPSAALLGEEYQPPTLGRMPLIERFTAPTGGELERIGYEQREEAEQMFGEQKLDINTRAQRIFDEIKLLPPEEQQAQLDQLSLFEDPAVVKRIETLMGKQEEKLSGANVYPQETGAQVIMVQQQTQGMDPVGRDQFIDDLWFKDAINEGAYVKLTREGRDKINHYLDLYGVDIYPSFTKIGYKDAPEDLSKKYFNWLVYRKMLELENENDIRYKAKEGQTEAEAIEESLREYYTDLRAEARDAVMEQYGLRYPEKSQSMRNNAIELFGIS